LLFHMISRSLVMALRMGVRSERCWHESSEFIPARVSPGARYCRDLGGHADLRVPPTVN